MPRKSDDAAAQAPAPEQAPELAPANPPEPDHAPEQAKASRKGQILDQGTELVDPRTRFALADDYGMGEWADVPGGGVIGVTRSETPGNNGEKRVRDFLTYIPSRGRLQSIPLFAVLAHPDMDVLD